MISKCANPACSALFRYLHEGRLFPIECPGGPEMNASAHDGEFVGAPHIVRYFWLCSTCCRTMTLVPKAREWRQFRLKLPTAAGRLQPDCFL